MAWRRIFSLVSLIGLMATMAAAENCADRSQVIGRLKAQYGEHLAMGGLQATERTQSVMEIWVSERTGTFTVLMTGPDGMSCIVAAGTDYFKARTPEPEVKGISG